MAAQNDDSNQNNNQQPKGYPIKIYVYDLSQGMAAMYSQQLIGKKVDGIWHTAVIVYETEYFYGGGIQSDTPGTTPYGNPLRTIDMGTTCIPQSLFHEFLNEIAPRFSMDKYDLFKHNCNTFANEAINFLNGRNIPEYITGLPDEFLNSAAGQMLKPMIDQMQQGAMAQYGDFGGVGLAAKPNLPQINPKYNIAIDDDNQNSQNSSQNLNTTENSQNTVNSASQPLNSVNNVQNVQNIVDNQMDQANQMNITENDVSQSLTVLLKEHSQHKHQTLEWKVFGNELGPKITADSQNAKLYVSLILKTEINERQRQSLQELGTLIDRLAAAKRKGLKLKLSVSEGAFECIDEMLLMASSEEMFPLVSLLRLLLCLDAVRNRYCADFMIIQQMLYKIGIPFETEVAEEDQEEKQNDVGSDDEELNLSDLHLLQFTAISAVSHLYGGQGALQKIEGDFVNLGINALRVRNANVRLAAARLLFNLVCELKRASVLQRDDEQGIESVMKEMNRVCAAALKFWQKEDHEPTAYRLLCIIALGCYCDDGTVLNKMNVTTKTVTDWKTKGDHANCEAVTNLLNDLETLVV